MRTGTKYFKTFSKMTWLFALLLVVFSAGCDRQSAEGVIVLVDAGPAGSVNLGTASTYGIIAYNAITIDDASSHIYGNVALTGPTGTSTSVTGAGASNVGVVPTLASTGVTNSNGVNPGIVDSSDNGNAAILPQLQIDLNAAYLDLLNRPAPATPLTTAASARGVSGGTFTPPSPDLSGFVLSPGIYTATGTYGLSNTAGSLVLDGGGNPGAVFIIRSTAVGPSGLTSTTGSVVLRNGARPTNVYWLVDNATIGAGTFFQGTVVAGSTITVNAGANVQGRMLAGGNGAGAITLTSRNIIVVPAP